MTIRIFYSWQTQTPSLYNQDFQLSCINESIDLLRKIDTYESLQFEVINTVRGAGTADIAHLIKHHAIPTCDIFVSDLTFVNKANWFARFFISNYRLSPNLNVIDETSRASAILSDAKIIRVMNINFGKPEDLPFDMRNQEFPIGYSYNKSTKNVRQMKANFVSLLSEKLKKTIHHALVYQTRKYDPFLTWQLWADTIQTESIFRKNEKVDEVYKLLDESLDNPHESVRILGLSGLGKTRMLFEYFRPNSKQNIVRSSEVLYLNLNESTHNYLEFLRKLISDGDKRILILDNCSIEEHRKLVADIRNVKNKNLLISIDSNPEEFETSKLNSDDVKYQVIKKEDLKSIVDEILKEDFQDLDKDRLEKIRDFAQGIPLMAVLLADSVRKGKTNLGILDDNTLFDNLLGLTGQDDRKRTILHTCAIFDYFGTDGELRSQLKFISSNKSITPIDGSDVVIEQEFDDICQHLLKREIFETKGRYIGMRPLPLAMFLAEEWLSRCKSDRMLEVINNLTALPQPHGRELTIALGNQMRYLSGNDRAIEITNKVFGHDGPFDNAEVLNTELGSRLFRSFVEVNPVAIADNLTRNFINLTNEELLNFTIGRRNLVWTLEKLCFDKRTFEKAVKILFAFASAETESISNNSTGQLTHLFSILLPGTEADLEMRWSIIEWAFAQNSRYKDLAIKAMMIGLESSNFARIGGAEIQGTKKLEDFRPSHEQIFNYRTKILNKLVGLLKEDPDNVYEIKDLISTSISSFFYFGCVDEILDTAELVAKIVDYDWDKAINSLEFSKFRYKENLSPETLLRIDLIINSLIKTDFLWTYKHFSEDRWLDRDTYTNSVDRSISGMSKLGQEFIESDVNWEKTFPDLYSFSQPYSYYFGKEVGAILSEHPQKAQKFLELSLEILLSIPQENRQLTLLSGFLSQNLQLKSKLYDKLKTNDELRYILFYLVSVDVNGKNDIDMLFDLISAEKASIMLFKSFAYSPIFNDFQTDELIKFGERLLQFGPEGAYILGEILFDVSYSKPELRKSLHSIFKQCLITLSPDEVLFSRNNYKWRDIIVELLNDNEVEIAVLINNSIIDSSQDQYYFSNNYVLREIYGILLNKYFDQIWPYLSDALLSDGDNYMRYYTVNHILGGGFGSLDTANDNPLFTLHFEDVIKWCRHHKDIAPVRIANMAPIYEKLDIEVTTWHPVAKKLIDEFGEDRNLLNAIDSNMGTFTWAGSIIPLLETKKHLFEEMRNHRIPIVRTWAENHLTYLEVDIEKERLKEIERGY